MQKVFKSCVTFVFLSMVVGIAVSRASAEPGLLLVAHGSPSAKWNEPVFEFGRRVAKEVEKRGRFKAVRTAMLEFAKPDVPTAVAELEAAGCDRIIAVPLFIAPSGHSHFDVPAVLGIYWSPRIAAVLAEEGGRAARPNVPIMLTQTLAEGDVLQQYALDQVQKLSKTPENEAIVLLAHGDADHALMIERLLRRIVTHCCGKTGISFGNWAGVGVGQEYPSAGLTAINEALGRKKRVLVVGLYLSTTAANIHRRGMRMANPRGHIVPGGAPFDKEQVVMSEEALIAHPRLVQWAVETAVAALDANEPTKDGKQTVTSLKPPAGRTR